MRIALALVFAAVAVGCAGSSQSLERAVSLHNTAVNVLEAADSIIAPLYVQAAQDADTQHPDDDSAYHKAMAIADGAVSALKDAKQTLQVLHLAIDQWQQGLTDGSLTTQLAECAAISAEKLGDQLVALPAGRVLYAAAGVLAEQLHRYADGEDCDPISEPRAPPEKPPSTTGVE